ncbi:MAG: hypothetical protein OEW08_05700 [Gammaproteobacteria bacterium]|nr:hypothetical protein [Gammaproteobacteria bacterium]
MLKFSPPPGARHALRWAAVALLVTTYTGAANALPTECVTTPTARGYEAITCTPAIWNGVLVTYTHGYVAPQLPMTAPDLTLPDGQDMPSVFLAQHFAFATTSFKNGYAVEQAAAAINDAVDIFNAEPSHPPAAKVLAMGLSLGASVTTMLVEKQPKRYHGGLSLCGPVAGMPYEVKYLGDFRTVFDYYFPGIFPFGVVDVPATAFLAWNGYVGMVVSEMSAHPEAVGQLFAVTGGAYDPNYPQTFAQTALAGLFFDIFGMNDIIATAGGNPYGNMHTQYSGSADDVALNAGVARIRSDHAARRYVRKYYEPEGELRRPMVTLHNLQDPAVPYRHEIIYAMKVAKEGSSKWLTQIPVDRYGHCAFTSEEILGAFNTLAQQALQ